MADIRYVPIIQRINSPNNTRGVDFIMNRRMVIYMLGQIIKCEAAMFALPAAVSLIYNETSLWAFLISAAIALIVGFALTLTSKPSSRIIFAKEGFIIVALAWVALSAGRDSLRICCLKPLASLRFAVEKVLLPKIHCARPILFRWR